jgi:methyl-accepting chemotaxis protein
MIHRKNQFIFKISLGTVLLSLLSHLLHRQWNFYGQQMGHSVGLTGSQYSSQYGLILNILLAIPIVLLAASYLLFRTKEDHPWVPYLNTLVLTFSSISIIAGGGGQVELHFSIFMVVAMLAYYERIVLVLVMTVVFAVQHLAGYWIRPEIVFGSHDYPFQMVWIHVLFLLLTAGATMLSIHSAVKIRKEMEAAKQEEKDKLLGDIVNRLSAASSQIVQTAGELSANAARTTETSNQIVESMQQIATGTETQVQGSEENVRAMDEISSGVNRIAAFSSEVSDTAKQSAEQATEGNGSVQQIADQIGLIHSSVTQTDVAVKSLYERSQEISEMVNTITSVAGQTDLLALNAAIEASRAGEQGRGFAVVASEVRKLAEQSRGMAEQIAELVEKMQGDSLDSVKSIQHVKEEVQTGLTMIASARNSFEQLTKLSQQVADHVQDISATAEQISAGSEQVTATIHNLSGVASDNAVKSRSVSAQSHEQLSLIDHIHHAAALLHSSSQELELIMEKIKEDE